MFISSETIVSDFMGILVAFAVFLSLTFPISVFVGFLFITLPEDDNNPYQFVWMLYILGSICSLAELFSIVKALIN